MPTTPTPAITTTPAGQWVMHVVGEGKIPAFPDPIPEGCTASWHDWHTHSLNTRPLPEGCSWRYGDNGRDTYTCRRGTKLEKFTAKIAGWVDKQWYLGRLDRAVTKLDHLLGPPSPAHRVLYQCVKFSEHGSYWFPQYVARRVTVHGLRTEWWGPHDFDDCFMDQCNCIYYSLSHFEQCTTEEGDIRPSVNCYIWACDGEPHSYPEPEDDDYDNEDEDDEDDFDGANPDGYQSRCNERLPASNNYDLGVELEVKFASKQDRSDAIVEIRDLCLNSGFATERDGSLDDDKGMEIVQLKPLPLDKASEDWLKVLEYIPNQRGNTGYGMHVSINTASWPTEQRYAFVPFWTMNEDLVYYFAKRTYGEYTAAGKKCQHLQEKYNEACADKYLACSVRTHSRTEVRIFRTTHWPGLLAARLQLVDAVARWCESVECTPAGITNITGKKGLLEFMQGKDQYAEAVKRVSQWVESTLKEED